MDKFKLNANELEKNINAPKMLKLADVQDQIRKVAFDVVTFRSSPETLWRVVPGDDGDYIVADYPIPNEQLVAQSAKNAWSVETDRLNKTATIFYHDTPIVNINVKEAKIDDVEDFKYRVPIMFKKNASLVKKMLNSLEDNHKRQILNKYPELQ